MFAEKAEGVMENSLWLIRFKRTRYLYSQPEEVEEYRLVLAKSMSEAENKIQCEIDPVYDPRDFENCTIC